MRKVVVAMVMMVTVLLPAMCFCAANEQSGKTVTDEVMQLLAAGNRKSAEARLADSLRDNPKGPDLLFLDAIPAQSRFEISTAMRGLALVMQSRKKRNKVS